MSTVGGGNMAGLEGQSHPVQVKTGAQGPQSESVLNSKI
jgi:hypothetical protein